MPQLMEARFGRNTKLMFSFIIVVMYSILNLPVILYSGAVVFENIFDVSGIFGISKFQAVVILCVIIGIIEDVQFLMQNKPEKLNAWAAWDAAEPALQWPLIFMGMFFNNLYWWCTNQSCVQRPLAAKSLKEGQKGAIYCGFL